MDHTPLVRASSSWYCTDITEWGYSASISIVVPLLLLSIFYNHPGLIHELWPIPATSNHYLANNCISFFSSFLSAYWWPSWVYALDETQLALGLKASFVVIYIFVYINKAVGHQAK
jgi:hypothetical protein